MQNYHEKLVMVTTYGYIMDNVHEIPMLNTSRKIVSIRVYIPIIYSVAIVFKKQYTLQSCLKMEFKKRTAGKEN
jgi:hypothetical protein